MRLVLRHGQLPQPLRPGQLHSISRAGTLLASYAYDHRGLRVRKSTSAAAAQGESTVHYHHDHEGRLIAETTGTDQPLKSYVWLGDLPLAVIEHQANGVRVLYLEADQLNSPIAARDASGRIVWRWDADAFGSTAPDQDPDGDGQQTTVKRRLPVRPCCAKPHLFVVDDFRPSVLLSEILPPALR